MAHVTGIIAAGQTRIIPISFHEYLRAGRKVVDARDLYLIGYVFGAPDCEPIPAVPSGAK